jgi:signal peptidase II
MSSINFKKIIINCLIIVVIFAIDRISKIYILKIAEVENSVDIYLASFLNLNLIWNKGIAFGLFSYDQSFIYNFITILIVIISVVILFIIIKAEDYRGYFFILILGGSLGNLYDRLYYFAVPDFIDFHINNFHWFIFNVADIFISLGVICLIFVELFLNKRVKNEIK